MKWNEERLFHCIPWMELGDKKYVRGKTICFVELGLEFDILCEVTI